LPDDLRAPSFQCAFCRSPLATAAFVGSDIARAEQMRDFFRGVVANPQAPPAPPPRDERAVAAMRADFAGEIQRQIAGNQALAKLRAEGVPCHRCGARNPILDPTAVQVVCAHCRSVILLSDHVGEDALARARMKQGIVELRAGIAAETKRRDRRALVVALVIVVAMAVVIGTVMFLQRG
jgi:hypothetical protein